MVESFSKDSIAEFTGIYSLITRVAVQKWDGDLVLVVVATGFSSFLELNLSTENGYVRPTVRANRLHLNLSY